MLFKGELQRRSEGRSLLFRCSLRFLGDNKKLLKQRTCLFIINAGVKEKWQKLEQG